MTYEELKQKHVLLPDYEAFNAEFDLAGTETWTLNVIKKRMAEKFEIVLDTFDHILQPNPDSIADMHEIRTFTEGEKKAIFDTYRKLMYHYRAFLENDFTDETSNARVIRAAYDDWKNIKTIVKSAVKKLKDSWEKPVEEKEILEYFG